MFVTWTLFNLALIFFGHSSMDPSLVVVNPFDPEVGSVDKADKDLLAYFR